MRDLAPILALGICMLVPIVSMLMRHQQKMAMILRSTDQSSSLENAALRRDMAELKALMHQQALALDDISDRVKGSTALGQRLENVGR